MNEKHIKLICIHIMLALLSLTLSFWFVSSALLEQFVTFTIVLTVASGIFSLLTSVFWIEKHNLGDRVMCYVYLCLFALCILGMWGGFTHSPYIYIVFLILGFIVVAYLLTSFVFSIFCTLLDPFSWIASAKASQ